MVQPISANLGSGPVPSLATSFFRGLCKVFRPRTAEEEIQNMPPASAEIASKVLKLSASPELWRHQIGLSKADSAKSMDIFRAAQNGVEYIAIKQQTFNYGGIDQGFGVRYKTEGRPDSESKLLPGLKFAKLIYEVLNKSVSKGSEIVIV